MGVREREIHDEFGVFEAAIATPRAMDLKVW